MPKMKFWNGSSWVELDAKNADNSILLNGKQASEFAPASHTHTASDVGALPISGGTLTNVLTVPTSVTITGTGNKHLWFRNTDGSNRGILYDDTSTDHIKLRKYKPDGTYNEIRLGDTEFSLNGNNIWHAGNDGSGSGLDADLLDGQHLTKINRLANNFKTETAQMSEYPEGITLFWVSNNNTWGSAVGGSSPYGFVTTYNIGGMGYQEYVEMYTGVDPTYNGSRRWMRVKRDSNNFWQAWKEIGGGSMESDLFPIFKRGSYSSYGSWVNLYSVTGKGLFDTILTYNPSTSGSWQIRITVDGKQIIFYGADSSTQTSGFISQKEWEFSNTTNPKSIVFTSPSNGSYKFDTLSEPSFATDFKTDGSNNHGIVLLSRPIFFKNSLTIDVYKTSNSAFYWMVKGAIG